jgi:hypothetical protein
MVLEKVLELVLASAAGAFVDIGVFVGAVLLLFGYLNYKMSGRFVSTITQSKRWQPVLGALLGVTPGCGGTIFLMPLFIKGSVTFGAVVAALIATTGDSSFVMIAGIPRQYIVASAIAVLVGMITGYVIDGTQIGSKLRAAYEKNRRSKSELKKQHNKAHHTVRVPHIGHADGDDIDLTLHHHARGHQATDTLAYRITHYGYAWYWLLLGLGLVLGILGLAQVDINALAIPNLGLIVGVSGTVLSIVWMLLGKKLLTSDTHEETEQKVTSLRETLIHNAQETAFVITWVFVGLLVYELAVLGIGRGDYAQGELLIESMLRTAGIAAVLIGALVGMIPGCGPQIIFVTLFMQGHVPFAALIANAISQDGDAILPLIALDQRSAWSAVVITTVPAALIGLVAYWLELNTDIFAALTVAWNWLIALV